MSSPSDRPVKVMVLGVRGIPNVQGGIETHAEHLYERLAKLGCDVEVIVRTPFVPRDQRALGPIRLKRIWSPTRPGLEALIHSMLGVLYASVVRPDILHIHAVGPAIVTPLARLFGLRVVMTHHGPDYDRDKWGGAARFVLRTGERFGAQFSHARIAISKVIVDLLQAKYGKGSDLVPNGVLSASLQSDSDHVQRFGLTPGRYFLLVSRMVPEKRQIDLIQAFARAQIPGWKLALVGGLTDDDYCRKVSAAAAQADGVVLTGFQKGAALQQLYRHAGVFVLPSTHEGLPIAMLEALSYGLPVLASDIPANLEVGLEPLHYFPAGNIAALAQGLARLAALPQDEATRAARREWVARKYDWTQIAERTVSIYRRVLDR
jgi:glycosyltransferase involved in cell wall biosynthesis